MRNNWLEQLTISRTSLIAVLSPLRHCGTSLRLILTLALMMIPSYSSANEPSGDLYKHVTEVVVQTRVLYPRGVGLLNSMKEAYDAASKDMPSVDSIQTRLINDLQARLTAPGHIIVLAPNATTGNFDGTLGNGRLFVYFELTYWDHATVSPVLNHDIVTAKVCQRSSLSYVAVSCTAPFVLSLPDDIDARAPSLITALDNDLEIISQKINCANGGTCK